MESTPQEEAEGRALVQVLAEVLERLVATNAHLAAASPQEETKFHALRAPAIGIRQYLERIHKYASCSKECFVLGLVYIDRLIRLDGLLLTDRCAHRVVVTAILLAAKFSDDAYYNNAYYARVGGVLTAELNALECEFLFRIDFGLRVTPEVFEQYHAELLSHASGTSRAVETPPPSYAPVAPQNFPQSEIDTAVYSNPSPAALAPLAQAPVLQPYSQTEVDPALYSTPALAAPQDGSAAFHYPIEPLRRSVTSSQTSLTAGFAPGYTSFPIQAPPTQYTRELDLVFPTPAAPPLTGAPQDLYPNQAQPLGATSSMPQANFYAHTESERYFHTSTVPSSVRMDDASPSCYPVHGAMAAAPAHLHSHQVDPFARHTTAASSGAPGTAWQPSAPLQSHPEITPSPHAPRPPIALQHVADCHLSHCRMDDALWSAQRSERVFGD